MTERTDRILINDLFENIPREVEGLFSGIEYPWQVLERLGSLTELCDLTGYRKIGEDIYVGENVKIAEGATLIGPLVISEGTEIRPGAYLRGRVFIGKNCVIGNSTELKNSVILDGAQLPHYNYVGDSVIGNRAHMGAGAIASNLKSGGGNVTVRGGQSYETGRRKLGAILGDRADVGCGSVLNPGTVIGKDTTVYPLVRIRGVVPARSIVKSEDTTVPKR